MLSFNFELAYWRALVKKTVTRPTHLDEIIIWYPTCLSLCGASGVGARVVWRDPTKSGTSIMWNHTFPYNITNTLVLESNLGGVLANSDLKLSALFFHKSTLLTAFPKVRMVTSFS